MEKSVFTPEYKVLLAMLREARLAASLSQVELAKRIGETQSYVSKCERGERRLDVIQLREVCRALDSTLTDFVAEFEARLGRRKR